MTRTEMLRRARETARKRAQEDAAQRYHEERMGGYSDAVAAQDADIMVMDYEEWRATWAQ